MSRKRLRNFLRPFVQIEEYPVCLFSSSPERLICMLGQQWQLLSGKYVNEVIRVRVLYLPKDTPKEYSCIEVTEFCPYTTGTPGSFTESLGSSLP